MKYDRIYNVINKSYASGSFIVLYNKRQLFL